MDPKVSVTLAEENGNSVVLLTNSTATMLPSMSNIIKVENKKPVLAEVDNKVKSQVSSITLPDVDFNSLLSKHLYSTTMTGSNSQLSQQSPGVKNSMTVTDQKAAPTVVVIPSHNPVNLVPTDLLRMGTVINNQGVVFGNGQNMAQIIYVPIIAAPQAGNTNLAANAAVLNQPLNFGMLNALPIASNTSSLNNIVYIQPQLQSVPIQQQSSVGSAVNFTPLQQTLVNVPLQPQVSMVNLNEQQPTSLVSINATPMVIIPSNQSQKLPIPTNPYPISNETQKETKKKNQKRKCRIKSVSSDTSSVDSNANEQAIVSFSCRRTGLSVSTKKIERVRKTVKDEDELNNKVSGLVSKILSQFPKSPELPSRSTLKSPKRVKQDFVTTSVYSESDKPSTNGVYPVNIVTSEHLIPLIPSTVLSADEGTIIAANNQNNTDIKMTKAMKFNQKKSSKIHVDCSPISDTDSVQNHAGPVASGYNLRPATEKPLVSTIELNSLSPNTITIETTQIEPVSIIQIKDDTTTPANLTQATVSLPSGISLSNIFVNNQGNIVIPSGLNSLLSAGQGKAFIESSNMSNNQAVIVETNPGNNTSIHDLIKMLQSRASSN